ncbi:MAG: 6-phosphogluconolactonase [Solirubrobacteraceae bacterium]
MAQTAAELIANRLRARPRLRMLLPTGHTPLGVYAALRAHAARRELPSEVATVFQLDEYRGVSPQDERSFAAYLHRELNGIPLGAVHGLDGAAADAAAECARHQRQLEEAPIDLAVLGLGHDGHVAFDEPGSSLESGTRVVALHSRTRADAAAEFGGLEHVPTHALTVGLRTLMGAREVFMLVTGADKADALQGMLLAPAGSFFPASLLRTHPRLTVICDAAAATGLRGVARGNHVAVVLGHRDPGFSHEHRISRESLGRVQRAEWAAQRKPTRAVVLTGYTSTGGLSEAEQMRAVWRLPGIPPVLEVAGRNTAGNAACSLPLVLALGGIRDVTVVTSAWHVRAPYMFATWRHYGLHVRFAVDWRGDWPRMLARELHELPAARRERTGALAATSLPPPSG